MQASSAAFSRCSLPGVMFHASPEQICCGTSSQLVPSLLRYQVYTAPSSLSVLPLTLAVKQPSVRMLSTSSTAETTAVCTAAAGAASSASITRVRAVSGVGTGSISSDAGMTVAAGDGTGLAAGAALGCSAGCSGVTVGAAVGSGVCAGSGGCSVGTGVSAGAAVGSAVGSGVGCVSSGGRVGSAGGCSVGVGSSAAGAGSAAGVGSASVSGSGAGGSGSAGAITAAGSAGAGSSSAAKTALAMPAAIQQASSTANRRFFMCGSSFAGFPRGACPPAGSIGSIPSAARGTRRGLLSAKRLQKKTHPGQKTGCVFFYYSLLHGRGRACPALHFSASARLWDTCGPGMPGPYRLCNGKMRCCGRLAGDQWSPLQSLGPFTPPSPASHSRRSRCSYRCPRG